MITYWRKKCSLTAYLVGLVFSVMVIAIAVIGCVTILLTKLGLVTFHRPSFVSPVLGMLIFSVILGTVITAMLSKRILKPIRSVIDATSRVAKGDFDIEIPQIGVPEVDELANSFNKMAQDLSGIETLRSDFVNNFSHEFKTPIVSIRGFAKLLKQPDISEEERAEYLDIIITESQRLADLSTSVLYLSKVENMEIMGEKETFLLDEQIRRTVLLLEPKWSAKQLELDIELESIQLYGNESMLQQVWVNLLDNAIKNVAEAGHLNVTLYRDANYAICNLQDDGCGMEEETIDHIFDKFYQGDTSHAKQGNGLGLPLVKKIIELCGGSIQVQSTPGEGSLFVVKLPLE